jgi:DNA-binding NtrC family response regulator
MAATLKRRFKTGYAKPCEHPYNLQRAIERFERGYLHNILVLSEWDRMRAAEMLGIHQKTLVTKLKKYDLVKNF